MIARNKVGRSFAGLVRYQFAGHRDQPVDKQAEILAARGVGTGSAAEITRDFEMGRAANPRLACAAWHIVLSFNPSDEAQLDSVKMRMIAEAYLKELQLERTQYLIVRHRDVPGNEHVHIILNRVDDTGKTLADGNNFYHSAAACKAITKQFGLTPPARETSEYQQGDRLQGAELGRHNLRKLVREQLRTATERPELLAALRDRKVTVQERLNERGEVVGISFASDNVACKGSELARELSSAGIDRQLAANRARQQAEAQEQAAEAMARVRAVHAQLLADQEAARQAEQAGDYGRVAELRYATIPAMEQQFLTARQQVPADAQGQLLLREFDQELAAQRAREQQQLADAAQQVARAQAEEQARAAVALALARVRAQQVQLADARAAGSSEQVLRDLTQRVEADRQLAAATPAGQQRLAELDAQAQREQRAAQELLRVAQEQRPTSWPQFAQRAAGLGYLVQAPANDQPLRVLDQRTQQPLTLPLKGQAIQTAVEQTIRAHEAVRQHEEYELLLLRHAQAEYWRRTVVRLRTDPEHAQEIVRVVGAGSSKVDDYQGADGRQGVTVAYNASGSTWQITKVVKEVRRRGGEVYEQASDALARQRSTQADYDSAQPIQERGQEAKRTRGHDAEPER